MEVASNTTAPPKGSRLLPPVVPPRRESDCKDPSVQKLLAELESIGDWTEDARLQMARCCERKCFPPFAPIAKEGGDVGETLYIIMSGSAQVQLNKMEMCVLGRGEVFGALENLDKKDTWTFGLAAGDAPTEVLEVYATGFFAMIELEQPALATSMRSLAELRADVWQRRAVVSRASMSLAVPRSPGRSRSNSASASLAPTSASPRSSFGRLSTDMTNLQIRNDALSAQQERGRQRAASTSRAGSPSPRTSTRSPSPRSSRSASPAPF